MVLLLYGGSLVSYLRVHHGGVEHFHLRLAALTSSQELDSTLDLFLEGDCDLGLDRGLDRSNLDWLSRRRLLH